MLSSVLLPVLLNGIQVLLSMRPWVHGRDYDHGRSSRGRAAAKDQLDDQEDQRNASQHPQQQVLGARPAHPHWPGGAWLVHAFPLWNHVLLVRERKLHLVDYAVPGHRVRFKSRALDSSERKTCSPRMRDNFLVLAPARFEASYGRLQSLVSSRK